MLKDTRGATSIEYGLIAGLIAAGLAAGLGILGVHMASSYDDTAVKIESATGPN